MAPVASTIDATLRVLLERLNWPVRMTRLVAAREYAKLLSSPAFGKKAAAAFLHWLSTRALESQVATGLAVLLCADAKALPPFREYVRPFTSRRSSRICCCNTSTGLG